MRLISLPLRCCHTVALLKSGPAQSSQLWPTVRPDHFSLDPRTGRCVCLRRLIPTHSIKWNSGCLLQRSPVQFSGWYTQTHCSTSAHPQVLIPVDSVIFYLMDSVMDLTPFISQRSTLGSRRFFHYNNEEWVWWCSLFLYTLLREAMLSDSKTMCPSKSVSHKWF